MKSKKKILNGEAYYTDKDISPERMKGVKKMFMDIEHIRLPYSGVELQRMVQRQRKISIL